MAKQDGMGYKLQIDYFIVMAHVQPIEQAYIYWFTDMYVQAYT